MSKQPEALLLANILEHQIPSIACLEVAATELRRLHEVNQALLEALKQLELVAHGDEVWLFMRASVKNQVGAWSIRLEGIYADDMKKRFEIINAAIAKAEGNEK